jgi:hypothetical protein
MCMLNSQNLAYNLSMSFLRAGKWNLQNLVILSVIPFRNFSYLFLPTLWLNFGYVSPHYIPEVQKNTNHFFLPEQSKMINSIGNPYQTKIKYINSLNQSKYMYMFLTPVTT